MTGVVNKIQDGQVSELFEIGERIIYGSEGVFTVLEYSSSPVDKTDGRIFYVLRSTFGGESSIIYTPVDNPKVIMRRVMTREQALSFIERIPSILPLTVETEKQRRDVYRDVIGQADSEGYVSLIKTVRDRREQYAKQKKRISDTDADYEKKAKYCLYGELSSALDIPVSEVERYIGERISALEK